jgi:signal peptidase I
MHAAKIEAGAMATGFPRRSEWREFVFGQKPNWTLARVLVWCALTVTFFHHLLVPIQIVGSSMNPTYQSGSLNLVNRLSYAHAAPQKEDVIALRADDELLLKRIVAGPGDTISITRGRIYLNHKPLADHFSGESVPWEMSPVNLGKNEYFVIGDNRSVSVFGKINKSQILGKLIF